MRSFTTAVRIGQADDLMETGLSLVSTTVDWAEHEVRCKQSDNLRDMIFTQARRWPSLSEKAQERSICAVCLVQICWWQNPSTHLMDSKLCQQNREKRLFLWRASLQRLCFILMDTFFVRSIGGLEILECLRQNWARCTAKWPCCCPISLAKKQHRKWHLLPNWGIDKPNHHGIRHGVHGKRLIYFARRARYIHLRPNNRCISLGELWAIMTRRCLPHSLKLLLSVKVAHKQMKLLCRQWRDTDWIRPFRHGHQKTGFMDHSSEIRQKCPSVFSSNSKVFKTVFSFGLKIDSWTKLEWP